MAYEKHFFETLAVLSQVTLQSAVAEVALKKDYESLAVFIDFLKTTPLDLLSLRTNASMTFPLSKINSASGNGVNPNVGGKTLVDHLLTPLQHGLLSKNHSALPLTVLDENQKTLLDRVVDLAETMKEKALWRFSIFKTLAETTNDPSVLTHLPVAHYNVASKTKSNVGHGDVLTAETTLASHALFNGNLALGTAMFRKMPAEQITGLEPNHPIHKNLCEQHAVVVTKAMETQPRAALDLLDVWEEKSPTHIQDMRVAVFKRNLYTHNNERTLDNDVLLTLVSKNREEFNRIECFLKTHEDGLEIAKAIVNRHFVEALPFASYFAKTESYYARDAKKLGIHNAISSSSVRVVDGPGEVRLKTTLEFLMAHGHELDHVLEDAGALKVLAMHGHKEDLSRKLHVLLALGADPKQKDDRNWLPSSHAGKHGLEIKQTWLNVERSFKARTRSFDLLGEIEEEAMAAAASGKPQP